MSKISTKLVLLLIVSALLPLTIFGIFAIWTSRDAALRAVEQGHLSVATRAADQIQHYVANRVAILQALSQHLGQTDLELWQKERIIRNYVINFDEYREIYLTDQAGQQVATSRLGVALRDMSNDPAFTTAVSGTLYRSSVFLSENLTPSMTIALPVRALGQVQGVLVGEINLIAMWNLVDSIRIGEEGNAFVVSHTGQLLAHGRGEAKPLVLREADLSGMAIVQAALQGNSAAVVYSETADAGEAVEYIGVSALIPDLGWGLIIEQPTREAYAQVRLMTTQLVGLIGLFLILVAIIGYVGGRRYLVEPIQQLMLATRRIAAGDLTGTVNISTKDEFQALGGAFNDMAGRLSELQEQIRRDERSVTFGRLAAGLAHDLRHPILNIENSSRLLMKRHDDAAHRERFLRIINRELVDINRFINDLQYLTRPMSMTIIPLDLRTEIVAVMESFHEEATKQGIKLSCHVGEDGVFVWADKFAIGRVLKNIIRNGLESMPSGGGTDC